MIRNAAQLQPLPRVKAVPTANLPAVLRRRRPVLLTLTHFPEIR
jgi:hypothetical protein